MVWKANILTMYPDIYPGPLKYSLIGKALENNIWKMNVYDIRKFGRGKHKTIDDKPFGGGAGMVMRADVLGDAIEKTLIQNHESEPLIYLSAKGKPLKHSKVKSYSELSGVSIICGHFEGIDQRVLDSYNIEEVSIGDFVVTGGEIASFVFLDAIIRLLPGVLGNDNSIDEESFIQNLLEYPHYTKPQEFKGLKVPDVLLSGNHEEINKWRLERAKELTKKIRPDLIKKKDKDK